MVSEFVVRISMGYYLLSELFADIWIDGRKVFKLEDNREGH